MHVYLDSQIDFLSLFKGLLRPFFIKNILPLGLKTTVFLTVISFNAIIHAFS